jgi:aminoglycoside phosphotransferase (APT) family kinase protein
MKKISQIKLEGRSGCQIEIIDTDYAVLVRKYASDIGYNHRLEKQVIKQQQFSTLFEKGFTFKAPFVIKMDKSEDGRIYFDMDYARGEKFSDILPNMGLSKLNEICEYLIVYFEKSFQNGIVMPVSHEVIIKKIEEVSTKIIPMTHYSEELKETMFNFLNHKIPEEPLTLGFCHGDFTFSNMLFNEDDNIFLFDFLDSFIESPLIDIVKLRQDTRFYWSVEIDENLENHKVLKVIQVLNYIDRKIKNYLEESPRNLLNWYKYLEVFNLVRIMPYAQKKGDIQFLQKHLTTLLK